MEVTCQLDQGGRSLWVWSRGQPISVRVRYRSNSIPPRSISALSGSTIPLDQFWSMLPKLTLADFKPTAQTPPELRADVGDWHVSILTTTQAVGVIQTADVRGSLMAWLREHLVKS